MMKPIGIKNLKVDIIEQKTWVVHGDSQAESISLTPTEFKFLSHFVTNPGGIFSREELIKLVWGESSMVSNHTVDTHISALRKKLGVPGQMIRAVVKKGYCLTV